MFRLDDCLPSLAAQLGRVKVDRLLTGRAFWLFCVAAWTKGGVLFSSQV